MESCVIQLGIFSRQLYFFLPFRLEQIEPTHKNTQPYYTTFRVITTIYKTFNNELKRHFINK